MDYSKSVGLNPKYNTFDLSHDKRMTLKMGTIVPIMAIDCLPGDKFTIESSHMTRFLPLVAPVMHKVKVKVRYFFSPNRLVWNNWEDFITGPESLTDTVEPTHPLLTVTSQPSTLSDYLGVSTSNNASVSLNVNALPYAHYQYIWHEYFRDQNLQPENDYWKLGDGTQTGQKAINLPLLKNVAWQHDRFTSALPFTQKGPEVTLPVINDNISISWNWNGADVVKRSTGNYPNSSPLESNGQAYLQGGGTLASIDNSKNLYIGPDQFQSATVNQLREAFAIQKWLELNARSGNRYTEHIQAHFGVKPQDARLQRPEEFGGSTATIQFSEVLQTSQTDTTALGTLGGHGITASGSRKASYYCQEHGWVFALMYVVPDTGYYQGLPAKFSKTDRYDYFQPLLAHIGEQPVYNKEVYADGTLDDRETFGYLPIYDEYRHEQNTVHGLMKKDTGAGGLEFWHLARKFSNRPSLNATFIECKPDDRIFTVDGDEQIIAHIYNDVKVGRKVPYYGTPLGL